MEIKKGRISQCIFLSSLEKEEIKIHHSLANKKINCSIEQIVEYNYSSLIITALVYFNANSKRGVLKRISVSAFRSMNSSR